MFFFSPQNVLQFRDMNSILDGLPNFTWQSKSHGDMDRPAYKHRTESVESLQLQNVHLTCAICTEELCDGCRVTRTPCSHVFHVDCLRPWLKKRHTCPLCRFELPTRPNTSVVMERVRPASSAPARATHGAASSQVRGTAPHHLRSDSVPSPGALDGGSLDSEGDAAFQTESRATSTPVLWTSIYRLDSASNPATWPIEKLQGVLEASGISYDHCNDHSSLVEMVILCLLDYENEGERYDRIHSLAGTNSTRQSLLNQTDAHVRMSPKSATIKSPILPPLRGSGIPDTNALLHSHRPRGPVVEQQALAGNEFPRGTTRGIGRRVGVEGCDGVPAGGGHQSLRENGAGGMGLKGSMKEMLAMARNGRTQELAGAILAAPSSAAIHQRSVAIRKERENEQLRMHEVFERERQRVRLQERARAQECVGGRHTHAENRGRLSHPDKCLPPPPVWAERSVLELQGGGKCAGNRGGASQVRDQDFGWCVEEGSDRVIVRPVSIATARVDDMVSHSLSSVVLARSTIETRSPLMRKKVAVGKDRTLFE